MCYCKEVDVANSDFLTKFDCSRFHCLCHVTSNVYITVQFKDTKQKSKYKIKLQNPP